SSDLRAHAAELLDCRLRLHRPLPGSGGPPGHDRRHARGRPAGVAQPRGSEARHDVPPVSALDGRCYNSDMAERSPIAGKTIRLDNRDVPFDDSKAETFHVDVFTEESVIDGIVRVGLGHLIAGYSEDSFEVKGDLHLRMTVGMAERTIFVLTRLVE